MVVRQRQRFRGRATGGRAPEAGDPQRWARASVVRRDPGGGLLDPRRHGNRRRWGVSASPTGRFRAATTRPACSL